MASSEGEGLRVIENLRGENFYHWKIKIELLLASLDLWNIVDESKEAPIIDVDMNEKKEFKCRKKKSFGLIATNVDETNFSHIISCKRSIEAWKTLCNIYESKNLFNIIYISKKFFTCKMEEGKDLMTHVNKVKALVHQLAIVDKPLEESDIVMILLMILSKSYNYVIVALESIKLKELTMDYVMTRLIYEITKKKKKEPQSEDSAVYSRQGKDNYPNQQGNVKSCFICGKVGHFIRNC